MRTIFSFVRYAYSNPVGCYEYECAGERYVDIVGVTVRKYAYEYE